MKCSGERSPIAAPRRGHDKARPAGPATPAGPPMTTTPGNQPPDRLKDDASASPEPPLEAVILETDPAPAGRPRCLAGEILAWIIILGITALVPVLHWYESRKKAEIAATQPLYEKPDVGF